MGHNRNHSFTGNTDHDFTGLVSGQPIIFNGTNLVSTGSTSTYKVYTALLTQSSTSIPTATILENTLGLTITWSRAGDTNGEYNGTFSNDTNILFTNTGIFIQPLILTPSSSAYGNVSAFLYDDPDLGARIVKMWTTDMNNMFAGADDLLNNTLIEIRVYN